MARGVFAHTLPRAEEYAELLATEATVRGLIGPREVPRLWERHLVNCAVVADLMPEGSSVCDIGSGAGLPGIVLAIRRPDLQISLVEPLLRRTTFLDLVVSTMGLHNVRVRRARAEDLHDESGNDRPGNDGPDNNRPDSDRGGYDVVTSRAVAPMERLARWSLPLVRDGGLFLAMKGASAADELERTSSHLARLGGRDARVVTLGEPGLDPPVRVISVRKAY